MSSVHEYGWMGDEIKQQEGLSVPPVSFWTLVICVHPQNLLLKMSMSWYYSLVLNVQQFESVLLVCSLCAAHVFRLCLSLQYKKKTLPVLPCK